MDAEASLTVGRAAIGRSLQIDGGEINRFLFRRSDFT